MDPKRLASLRSQYHGHPKRLATLRRQANPKFVIEQVSLGFATVTITKI